MDVKYCFDKNGSGTRTINTRRTNDRCVGPVRARFDSSGNLIMDADSATCSRGGGFYGHGVECTQQDGGKAICYGQERGGTRNKWKNGFRRN